MSGKSTEELIQDLGHADPEARRNAALFLGNDAFIGKDISAAVPALVKALGDRNDLVKMGAANALEKIGSSAVPALIGALRSDDAKVWWWATRALEKIGDAPTVPALIEALGDGEGRVRWGVVGALEKIGPKDSADLKCVANAAREAKKSGKPMDGFAHVYSDWSEKLNKRAERLIEDKKFHVPKVEKPNRTERVLRVRRLGA